MINTIGKQEVWTIAHCGRYIDCAYGQLHTLEKLEDLLNELPDEKPKEHKPFKISNKESALTEVQIELTHYHDTGKFSEFIHNTVEDTTELLNEYVSDNIVFTWLASDMVLMEISELE